jgi:hypothetical protein
MRQGLPTPDVKQTGKPIAGNRHDGFEVAGTGNRLTVQILRHSQRKRGATARLSLQSAAPVSDPTNDCRTFFAHINSIAERRHFSRSQATVAAIVFL